MDKNGKFKILVVDDTPELLDITIKALKKANYNVLSAATGAECLEIHKAEKPDIILMDVILPDANGKELAVTIKSDAELSPAYIILLSSLKTSTEDIAEGLELGADGYILRPINNRELLARIASACRIIEAEKESRAALSKYQSLFSSMQEGVYLHEMVYDDRGNALDYRIIEANPASEKHLNIKTKDAIGKLATELFGTNEAPFLDMYAEVARTGKAENFEQFFPPLGKHFQISAFSPGEGKFATVFSDITERKLDELAVKQTTEALTFLAQYSRINQESDFFRLLAQYLAKALDANYVCIDSLEGDGLNARTVAVWSDGVFEDNVVYALKDTPCGVLVGKTVCCFPASVCQYFPKDAVLQDLKAESYVGATLWSHTGDPIGLIAVIKRDKINNQKQAEELLKLVAVRAAGEMERLEAEKEILLKNVELEKTNAEKDKFFSIIAHDLKSPFNSILGFSELLIESANQKDCKVIEEYSKIIHDSSKRAMDLLLNLMEWAQSQTGRMDFNPENLNLAILLNEVNSLLGNTANQKSIKIDIVLPPPAIVYADKAMMSTILRNLISNAIKFTNPGGKILISAKISHGGTTVSVRDNGVGIPKETIDKLFRIDENYSTQGTNNEKGTGIGLILCKEFIEKHNGKIWVESEVGIGSTFYFSLPKTNSDLLL